MLNFTKQNGFILIMLFAGIVGLRKKYSLERLVCFTLGIILLLIATHLK